jgi:hypothetical protein
VTVLDDVYVADEIPKLIHVLGERRCVLVSAYICTQLCRDIRLPKASLNVECCISQVCYNSLNQCVDRKRSGLCADIAI